MVNDNIPGAKLSQYVHRRVFDYKGLQVEERICLWDEAYSYKLLWCLAPLENTVSNGVVNPVFNHDFTVDQFSPWLPSDPREQTAREVVNKEFDGYWFDSERNLTRRTIAQYKEWKEKQNASA